MGVGRAIACIVTVALLGVGGCATASEGVPAAEVPATSAGSGTTPGRVSVPTMIVLDASGSMNQEDAPGPRIGAAKAAVHEVIAGADADAELGLIAYGTSTGSEESAKAAGCRDIRTIVPLGKLDRDGFTTAVDTVTASGYTPIIGALHEAMTALPAEGERSIILVSDGEDTCSPEPPCENPPSIPRQDGLTIHTIGFKLDSGAARQLRCIADAGDGLSVDAANSAQLSARLVTVSDPDTARQRLTPTGLHGLAVGMTADEARAAAGDLGPVPAGASATVVWRDCDLTFTEGVLTEIAPRGTVATLDGLGPGGSMRRAVELYGPFVAENDGGSVVATFPADVERGTAYRITYTPSPHDSTDGSITRIVLCRCLPRSVTLPGDATEVVELTPVGADGRPASGWRLMDRGANGSSSSTAACNGPSPASVTPDVFHCGSSAAGSDACWPGTSSGVMSCLQDPWTPDLFVLRGFRPSAATGPVDDPRPIGLELENGLRCRLRNGGAWSSRESDPSLFGAYGCWAGQTAVGHDLIAVWSGQDTDQIDRSTTRWTVRVGGTDGPLETLGVERAYFVAAE